MEPVLVQKESFTIAGIKQRVGIHGSRIPQLYGKWDSRRAELEQAIAGRTFGVSWNKLLASKTDFNQESDGFDYLAGAEVPPEETNLPEGMEMFIADAGTYAVFTYKGTLEYITTNIDRIYQIWLPRKMYIPGDYKIEVYDKRFLGARNSESIMEVWVPVTIPE